MERRESWPLFRANHIIWTPSVGFADRNGAMHYSSPSFMPPSEFLSVLRIGRARCLMAWTRSAEAIKDLEQAASVENAMTPELLFWLSVAYFLEKRDNTRIMNCGGIEEALPRQPVGQANLRPSLVDNKSKAQGVSS